MTPDQQQSIDRTLHRIMWVLVGGFAFSVFSLGAVLVAKRAEVRAVKAEIDRIEAHLRQIDEWDRQSLRDRLDLRKRVEADQ